MADHDEQVRREEAFLALIRFAEHGGHDVPNVYQTLYGNGHFSNLNTHPNRPIIKWGHRSTAAGAYMITYDTFMEAVHRGVVHNFYEPSQDAIALYLIKKSGALELVRDGDLDTAFARLRSTWSALPGGSQQELTEEQAKAYFAKKLQELSAE